MNLAAVADGDYVEGNLLHAQLLLF